MNNAPLAGHFIFEGTKVALTKIRLTGVMAKRFGRDFHAHLDTNTSAEAFRALSATVTGFRSFVLEAEARGIVFAVWRGRGSGAENITAEQLREPCGGEIRIAPIIAGSKRAGVLNVIVGAVLVVIGGLITGWSFGTATPVGTAIAGLGLSMIAGGVVQLLSPQPKLAKAADSSDNQSSYVFNGPVNTTAQGQCVPVLYGGPMEIGSAVISAGIEAVDYSSRPSNVTLGTQSGNTKKTPYDDDLDL